MFENFARPKADAHQRAGQAVFFNFACWREGIAASGQVAVTGETVEQWRGEPQRRMSKNAARTGHRGYQRIDHKSDRRAFGRISLCAAVTRCPSQDEETRQAARFKSPC
jgi:hypothetical protein